MITVLILTVTTLWSIDNAEYIAALNKGRDEGKSFVKIDCRQPSGDEPYISIITPKGNELVCFKQR